MSIQKAGQSPRIRLRAEVRALLKAQGRPSEAQDVKAVSDAIGWSETLVYQAAGRQTTAASWLPRAQMLARLCDKTGIRSDYILFGALPKKLEDVRHGSWADDLCDWLVERLELIPEKRLDRERLKAFILAAVRAAESHDGEVFEEVIPIAETTRELLCHGLGDIDDRERWKQWQREADERINTTEALLVLDPPRWTRAQNTEKDAPSQEVSNVDIRPIPELRLSIAPRKKLRDVNSRSI